MSHDTLTLDCDALRESFREWQAEQESLEAEWNESLAALVAFQSHLDGWQKELAEQRDQLRHERESWEEERSSANSELGQSAAQSNTQLAEAREKITLLSQQLVARTEELRVLDQRRAELATELEVARAQAKSHAADAEQQKRALEQERSAWVKQLQQMRELLEVRAAAPVTGYDDVVRPPAEPAATPPPRPRPASDKQPTNNPVLGSIMEQFGKLRQQRAIDRQSVKKTR
jgi:chromosome segregation ATPase